MSSLRQFSSSLVVAALAFSCNAEAVVAQHSNAAQVALENDVRHLQSELGKAPADKQLRMKLVHDFDKLGDYCEKRGDTLNAWRYFQAAGEALSVLKDPASQAQAAKFIERSRVNHEARQRHIKGNQRLGLVLLAFKQKDNAAATAPAAPPYIQSLMQRLLDLWDASERQRGLTVSSEFAHPIIVEFKIGADGLIYDAKILSSCGNKITDQAALDTVKALKKLAQLPPSMGRLLPVEAHFVK